MNIFSAATQLKKVTDEAVQYMSEHGFERTPAQLITRLNNYRNRYQSNAKNYPRLSQDDEVIELQPNQEIVFCNLNELSNESNTYDEAIATLSTSTKKKMVLPQECKEIQKRNCNGVCQNMDSVDYYCMSLSANIKKLDARKQAKLKVEMMQLLYNAEFDPDF